MMARKMKLLSVFVGAVALIATPALARTVHKRAGSASDAYAYAYASADRAYGASTIVRWDGRVVGRDPDANVRVQLLRDAFADQE
jgi:hypothetical protein